MPGVIIAVLKWKTVAQSGAPHTIDGYNAVVVGLTILLEDIPQLTLNGIFMASMGADTDTISVLCMVASSLSVVFALCDCVTSAASALEAE